ncbi:hypothetical protein DVH05_001968 [Phytophthora capsici]|nr:hypothetical protein DVH05_001968 [Phytophthora capsici]
MYWIKTLEKFQMMATQTKKPQPTTHCHTDPRLDADVGSLSSMVLGRTTGVGGFDTDACEMSRVREYSVRTSNFGRAFCPATLPTLTGVGVMIRHMYHNSLALFIVASTPNGLTLELRTILVNYSFSLPRVACEVTPSSGVRG